jgi:hypothetical protein
MHFFPVGNFSLTSVFLVSFSLLLGVPSITSCLDVDSVAVHLLFIPKEGGTWLVTKHACPTAESNNGA